MKKLLIVLLVLFLSFSNDLKATHYVGGEITWECTPSGNFRFTMKLYRECYGVNGAAAQFGMAESITTSVPGFSSISLTRLPGYPKDISPQCNSDTIFPHIFCNNSNPMDSSAPNLGAIQEHIYTSDSNYPNGVPLSGIPPSNGWIFYYGGCCRNPSTNIINASSHSFRIRAKMYPYNNQNVSTCYDSSPTFADKPLTVISTGFPTKYNSNAYDVDLDSLTFKWAETLQSTGALLTAYSSGYSYLNPFGGTNTNLEYTTGEISFNQIVQGAFVYVIKVQSYKCGILLSEIFREFQIVSINSGTNSPPNVSEPFKDTSGQYALFVDTVYAGELVSFPIIGIDSGFLPNSNPQTLSLKATGSQFGDIISSTNPLSMSDTNGCLNPPCATLYPASNYPNNPLTGQPSLTTQFSWQTDCSHLATNANCSKSATSYNFVISIMDDYCPVPGANISTITIIVIPPPNLLPPNIVSVTTDSLTGDNALNWTPPIDSFNILSAYEIYSSVNSIGPFTILDTTYSNSYTHLGANGTSSLTYYYVKTISYCHEYRNSIPSDTVVSSFGDVGIKDILNQRIILSQNIPNPTNKTTTINYFLPKSGNAVFKVVNIIGEIVYSKEFESNQGENKIELDISNFESGVYYYSLEFDGILKVKKMVVLK